MASKYRDRILQSSGVSNKKVQSQYGMRIMMKMGWNDGKGLGKKETGITDCIQIKRRDDNLGLGVKTNTGNNFSWNDSWWNDAFNNSIKKLNVKIHGSIQSKNNIKNKKVSNKKYQESDSSDDSSDSSDNSSSSSVIPHPKLGKEKKIHKHKHHTKE